MIILMFFFFMKIIFISFFCFFFFYITLFNCKMYSIYPGFFYHLSLCVYWTKNNFVCLQTVNQRLKPKLYLFIFVVFRLSPLIVGIHYNNEKNNYNQFPKYYCFSKKKYYSTVFFFFEQMRIRYCFSLYILSAYSSASKNVIKHFFNLLFRCSPSSETHVQPFFYNFFFKYF